MGRAENGRMSWTTLLIFLVMYVYGFSLMIWAIFLDKHPTKKSVRASIIGLIFLVATFIYNIYVLATVGIT